ncbi:bifunctional phosphoglucose/phosphomannose isomerase [Caldicellulosiruptor bescii]|jgi:glucose/mannose-6-phosphate isomerase|nr:bifunctional phosphoglucose/phosphomannose isomerase [Caldicellulosiruptor bescii]ACM59743.1 bifunctional phosphoglucose/phosphomannose isomerase [Caldicellulosiruptor bescii DSM 6725]PBC87152.1 bifunctional phosphoglucose/phosphomannose isomerase [Caldicellulosiruptor bescii]PBC90091.1 bifunctional phosphoglucose/phosphomannose isomerase [Caldicellulosiruptor bescii]PBD04478.1 bifunctional phosphoglucose/phosphomannose isomerase [Caldicellulosiruptor bescii]PBD05888.1 bifunctional phosphog
MLDNLETIAQNDPSGMFESVYNLPEQIQKAYEIGKNISVNVKAEDIDKVVITGLGGSAIGGNLLRVFVLDKCKIPVIVNRDYVLPAYVDSKTLVIASSYSGNTEETLSAYQDAKAKGAKIIAITTGGKLKEFAEKDGFDVITIPSGLQPRAALGYSFIPLLMLFVKLGLIEPVDDQIEETVKVLSDLRERYKPEVPEEKNLAKRLTLKLWNKLPIIYGISGTTEVIAERWKGQICENSKSPAYFNVFSELNHNEIVGTESPKHILGLFEIVMLHDTEDHKRNAIRMDITKDLIKGVVSGVNDIYSIGNSRLARMFSLIYLGDYVSLYLATLYQNDPTPVKKIDILKNKLAEIKD